MNIEPDARDWIIQNTGKKYTDGRPSYEVDYGNYWTMDGTFSSEKWRVTWNSHTGVVYAYHLATNRLIKLAKFSTLVEADQAMDGWANPRSNIYRNLSVLAKHLQETGGAL